MSAAADGDPARLERLVTRRETGEPLAWVTGSVRFAGVTVQVGSGVFVPRYQTALLVSAALEVLPPDGVAIDLCTGSGAVAAALQRPRPNARVVATEIDPVACDYSRRNGVEVYEGDLDRALPPSLVGAVDVVTAVAPYVPTGQIEYLPRDFRDHEPRSTLDGGPTGTAVLERVVAAAGRLLRPGGWLLAEVGAGQDELLRPSLRAAGMVLREPVRDEDGDLRVLRASLG